MWATTAVRGAYVVRPRLVSLKIDHVHEGSVLENAYATRIKGSLAAELSEKWGVTVRSAHWLSGVEPDKVYGSMVIRLSNSDEAEDLLVAEASRKGTLAAWQITRLKGLRPQTARQLFLAKVVPVIDYASVVWAPAISEKTRKILDGPQKIAAKAIVGAFKTVSLQIAESEASISPVAKRHRYRLARFWIDRHTLPDNHTLKKLKCRITKRFCSPLAQAVTGLNL